MPVMLASELRGSNILVNSACPGWVRTNLGGSQPRLSTEQGADTPVWLATLPNGGPTGGFFRDRQPLAWLLWKSWTVKLKAWKTVLEQNGTKWIRRPGGRRDQPWRRLENSASSLQNGMVA